MLLAVTGVSIQIFRAETFTIVTYIRYPRVKLQQDSINGDAKLPWAAILRAATEGEYSRGNNVTNESPRSNCAHGMVRAGYP